MSFALDLNNRKRANQNMPIHQPYFEFVDLFEASIFHKPQKC